MQTETEVWRGCTAQCWICYLLSVTSLIRCLARRSHQATRYTLNTSENKHSDHLVFVTMDQFSAACGIFIWAMEYVVLQWKWMEAQNLKFICQKLSMSNFLKCSSKQKYLVGSWVAATWLITSSRFIHQSLINNYFTSSVWVKAYGTTLTLANNSMLDISK